MCDCILYVFILVWFYVSSFSYVVLMDLTGTCTQQYIFIYTSINDRILQWTAVY